MESENTDLIARKFPKFDEWDKITTSKIYNRYEGTWVRKWAIYSSYSGDPRLWNIVMVALIIVGFIQMDFSLFVIFIAGFLQSYAIYYVVKHKIIKRHRPYKQHEDIEVLDKTGYGYSFPSGHVHHSTILIGIIWLMYFPAPQFFLIIPVYNFLVGYSRMVSGVHYVSDTIFGALEGYLALFFYWFVTKNIYLNSYLFFAEFIPFLN